MTEKEVRAISYIANELLNRIEFLSINSELEWNEWMELASASFDKQMDDAIEELFSEE